VDPRPAQTCSTGAVPAAASTIVTANEVGLRRQRAGGPLQAPDDRPQAVGHRFSFGIVAAGADVLASASPQGRSVAAAAPEVPLGYVINARPHRVWGGRVPTVALDTPSAPRHAATTAASMAPRSNERTDGGAPGRPLVLTARFEEVIAYRSDRLGRIHPAPRVAKVLAPTSLAIPHAPHTTTGRRQICLVDETRTTPAPLRSRRCDPARSRWCGPSIKRRHTSSLLVVVRRSNTIPTDRGCGRTGVRVWYMNRLPRSLSSQRSETHEQSTGRGVRRSA
jgi:hypothetical protein